MLEIYAMTQLMGNTQSLQKVYGHHSCLTVAALFINDSNGIERDVVFGFDNAWTYTTDKVHGHWGAVPGECLPRRFS